MFTRLLPIRMALSASSYLSSTFTAILAARFPSSMAFSSLSLLAEENAISLAEKKAERHTSTTRERIYTVILRRLLPPFQARAGAR